MNFELIVATDINGIIGSNNNIPWYIPEDLIRFRKMTTDSVVIMGRKTFESLPNGKLKNRINIVITRNYANYKNDDSSLIFTDTSNIINIVSKINKKKFIIVGKEIYNLFWKFCKIIHITIVYIETNGEIVFPVNIKKFNNKEYYQDIYKSEVLLSKNNNTAYQYFTYSKNSIEDINITINN